MKNLGLFLLLVILSCNSKTKESSFISSTKITKTQMMSTVDSFTAEALEADKIYDEDIVPGEYLVLTESKADLDMLSDLLKNLEAKLTSVTDNVVKIEIHPSKDPGIRRIKRLIRDYTGLRAVEPNRVIRLPRPVA